MPPPKLPPNWPRDQTVAFIEDCVYSRNLKPEVLADIAPQLGKATPQSGASGCNRVVRIRPIDDPKHPAHGQYGLFSAMKLQPRSHVIDYLGFVHSDAESNETSNYDLRLADDVGVDASMMGNEARFLNDYRGVAQRPNVEFQTRRVEVTQQLRMAVFVGKWEVPKGQELLVSYGKGFWSARREGDVHRH